MPWHTKHEEAATPAKLKAAVAADKTCHPAVSAAINTLLDVLPPEGEFVVEHVGHLDPNGPDGKPAIGQNILIKIETRLRRDPKTGRPYPMQPGTIDESAEIVRLKAELADKTKAAK